MTWHSESRRWRSGAWSLVLRDDELADIAYDGRLVLRSVRAVVRDSDWDTAGLVVDGVTEGADELVLTVHSQGLGSSFAGEVRVTATGPELQVGLDLVSAAAFATNRTGLVVLHPPDVAGAGVEVLHPGGARERTAFPREISPHQPVRDIAGLDWAAGGLPARLRFEGDVFEMEDQRNWTDASFKTYSRPLALPFPYAISAGERVQQSVVLRVDPDHAHDLDRASAPVDVIDLRPGGAFPAILLGAATAPGPAPSPVPVGAGVLVEVDVAAPQAAAALARACAAGLPLDVRLVVGPDGARAVAAALAVLEGATVLRIGAFARAGDAAHVSDADAVAVVRSALAAAGHRVPVIGGVRSHFTELNRERHRIPDDVDALAVTVTPLFHATGTEQLIESVAMQRLVAQQTVRIAAGKPVHIGPVSLRPRFNNVATAPAPASPRTDLADGYGAELTGRADDRQSAPELAAWTIASAAALAVPGVASLAWFEEWGPRGIRTRSGERMPVADAVEALAAAGGAELLWGDSPDGLVWALGARRGAAADILAANLDRQARTLTVTVSGGAGRRLEIPPGQFLRVPMTVVAASGAIG